LSIDGWAEKQGLLEFPKASKRERDEGCGAVWSLFEQSEGLEEKKSGGMKGTEDQTLLTGSGNIRNNLNKNHHPTVKPVHLMAWLVRLVSKEGDTVLDPFAGSFTTGVACKMLDRNFIGIEKEPEYFAIGKARIDAARPLQPNLFKGY